jgi:hypothetical protein
MPQIRNCVGDKNRHAREGTEEPDLKNGATKKTAVTEKTTMVGWIITSGADENKNTKYSSPFSLLPPLLRF